MIRARFETNEDDYRPVLWPPPGPFWCTGYGPDSAIVVAYAADEAEILKFWPDAQNIDAEPSDSYFFSSRFPQPDWWPIATPSS